MLADRALASKNDVDESEPGVAEIKVSQTGKLVGLLEDLSRRLQKLETATSTMATEKRRNTGRARTNDNRAPRAQYVPNVQAKPFVPNRQVFFTNNNEGSRPNIPPPNSLQDNATTLTDTANAPVCYYHQTFGDKARTFPRPLRILFKLLSQSKVATLAPGKITEAQHDIEETTLPKLFPSKLSYVADKHNKCKYLIDTGAAVSVLPKSCANRISYANCLPQVAANNTTIITYGTSKRVVDVGLKREFTWKFIVADVQQPINRFSNTL